MRKSTMILFGLLLALTACLALAADVTGKWTGQMSGPDGGAMTIAFNLKQDGTKLTGSVEGPQGDPLEIKDGKVESDKISFTVEFNDMKIVHEGTIKGDEITLTVKMNGGEGPGPMTLKRAK